MTEVQVRLFAERVYAHRHKYADVDIDKDIALYVLDLLRQGYTVQGVLKKLKYCRELVLHYHDGWYADHLTRFSQAIRRCKTTEQWVSFHIGEELKEDDEETRKTHPWRSR